MGELERLAIFIAQTKKRKAELEYKKQVGTMNRAEMFELDMCNGDLKLWEPKLKEYQAKSSKTYNQKLDD